MDSLISLIFTVTVNLFSDFLAEYIHKWLGGK